MSSEALTSPLLCPPEWPLVQLKEVTRKIGSGATPTGGQAAYQPVRSQFVLVRSQNVFDRVFSEAGLAFISDAQAQGLKGAKLEADDLLLNITGDGVTFGRACKVPPSVLPACVNQHVCIIRLDPRKADPGYVLSYLTHPAIKEYIEAFNAGGSRRAITKAHIESFVLPLPALEVQRSISGLLSALDNRITLLRETNATLEAIAQALFKSWFVDFDAVLAKNQGLAPAGMDEATAALFPDGFEEMAEVRCPRSWRVGKVEDLLELAYGKALKATDRLPGEVPVYGSGGVAGNHNVALVEGPGVVVGRKGTIGSLYWEDRPFYPIDTVFYVRPRVPLAHCFHQLSVLGLNTMNTDGAVPGLNRNNVYRLQVVVPPPVVLDRFNAVAIALRSRISSNLEQRTTLSELRDALLPRLISGQLRLPEAEAIAESAL